MYSTYEVSTTDSRQPDPPRPGGSDNRRRAKRAKSHDVDYGRLFEAMRYGGRVLSRFREERRMVVQEYVGRHYSDGGSQLKVPVNHIARYITTMARALVPHTPQFLLTTKEKGVTPAVSAMADWMNVRVDQMHLGETLQRWVIDSLLSVGILKVALGDAGTAANSGYVSPAGVPFAEVVDLDDFVFDAGARDFRHVSFAGHRFRIPREVAEEMDYEKKGKLHLSGAMSDRNTNQDGDERITTIGSGYEGGLDGDRDFDEMVDLWEIYIPRKKLVCTFASDAGGVPSADCEPLRVQEWVGPDCGPFHYLCLLPVPGSAMPKGMVQDLIDLHQDINSGYRKLTEQMRRQKNIVPVRGAAMDDARRVKQASDGDMFLCENADAIKELSYGGPNPANAQFVVHLSDVFNKMAGNLDLINGSNPQSKTATQDKILNENAGAGIADTQERTVSAISKVGDALGWFWWYHPEQVMRLDKSLPGASDIKITRELYPAGKSKPNGMRPDLVRQGRYEDLHMQVDPYSLVYKTPQQRLADVDNFVKLMMPMMQLLGGQGIQFDAMSYTKMRAELANEPRYLTIFTVSEPMTQGGGGGEEPGMASQTSREYIRRSQGSDTQANRASNYDNSMSSMAAAASGGQE